MVKSNIIKVSLIILSAILIIGCSDKEKSAIKSYFGIKISEETLDSYLGLKMNELNIPGISISLINNGEVVYHKTIGYHNKEQRILVNANTIFEGASLSKPLFAYFVMKYVDEGKLDLDTPLFEYLPYLDIAHDERYKKITARMVLSHRTGFPNWRANEPDNRLRIKFEPGTNYGYSGEGYQYLAMVLKHLDGTDWDGLEKKFQEKVAQPLGMKHTVFIQDSYTKIHKADPYDKNGNWVDKENGLNSKYRFQFRAPESVHTEALDFSKWLIDLMKEEQLTKSSYKELFKPHSLVEEQSNSYYNVNYTLGFFRPDIPFTNLYIHGGNNYGFTSWFAFDKNKEWGYVLFTNSDFGGVLGNDLLFYLLAGPNKTMLYLIVGIVFIMAITLIIILTRIIVFNIRKKHQNVVRVVSEEKV
jgi:CubicO group peptidase (beta-lactamase class C family)